MIAQDSGSDGSIRLLGCALKFNGKTLRGVMYRQHVNLVSTDESVDDTVRPVHNFPDEGILEFRNSPTRFWELDQAIGGGNETSDDDRRVMRRISTDESANGGQVGTSLLGPENTPHDKNCFLTSSWDTSWRASD